MKIDLTSLSFNSILEEGVGTPSWGTALGQSEGYDITTEGASDLLLGMFNNKINDMSLEHNFRGEKDILIASCFRSVSINGIKVKNPFIIAVVEEHSKSHDGRKSLKYNDKFKFKDKNKIISNEDFYKEVQSLLGENSCWFAYEINILNGKDLNIKVIVVSENPVEYINSKERKDQWNSLIGINPVVENKSKEILRHKVIGQFVFNVIEYLVNTDKIYLLQNYLKINSDNRFSSLIKDESKLTSMFWLFKEFPTDEQLSQGGKIRAFNKCSFENDNLMYFLSKEWTDQVGHRLDINNLIIIFNSIYSDFQITKLNDEYFLFFNYVSFKVNDFQVSSNFAGLIFTPQLIQRFVASLCTKPFVICSGLSGSGKTKIAQAFAQWISVDKSQYVIVPVGADWTNREPLLGYPNALAKDEYVSPENGVLDLMIRAKQNFENSEEATKPYFLILDEMNLSHVERYFADFLSTMESGSEISLHKIESGKQVVPQSIKLPKNLFIIGTVNIDETTYMFSPKVLDRANTIEFRLTENDLEEFINSDIKLDMDILTAQGANMAESFMKMALLETDKNLKPNAEDLKLFFSELKKSGAEFGYRTASEIGRLMYMLKELGEDGDNLLDIAIMQKLLPKLHGSRSKLNTALTTLAKFCVKDANKDFEGKDDDFRKTYFIPFDKLPQDLLDKIKYKISFEKISRMHKNAIENGFTSYAEA